MEIHKFEQILCQFKEETRRFSSANSRVDDAEMAQRRPKLRIKEFLRHTLINNSALRSPPPLIKGGLGLCRAVIRIRF